MAITSQVQPSIEALAAAFSGPLVTIGPSSLGSKFREMSRDREVIPIARGMGRTARPVVDLVADLPHEGVVIVDSPSDPLGALTTVAEAVRLARACQVVLVDERYAGFSGFTLLPLVTELENVIVMRAFAHGNGHDTPQIGWMAAPSQLAAFATNAVPAPDQDVFAAAVAALSDLPELGCAMRRAREERSRLYRLLRKFSFLAPVPSWGPFISARVEIGTRDWLAEALQQRSVRVYRPNDVGLEQFIRIGIGTRSEMDRLRAALLDVAPELMESVSA
ncbi:MAG: aminotransferase class I/II-fold pyridoxal phosphate-dependent enzyme [Thermomicrobiales bacterium]